jgi:cytochrome P450
MDARALGELVVDHATYTTESKYHALFEQLRRDDPVCWAAPEGYRPFWLITKHADVRDVEGRSEQFLNASRTFLIPIEDEEKLRAAQAAGVTSMGRSVVELDGREHRLLRLVTQGWFAPPSIAKLKDQIRQIANESIDAMAQRDSCDFVRDVASWYPLRVILLILGLPREDEAHLLKLTQAMFAPSDPDSDAEAGVRGMIEASQGIRDYFEAVTRDRRKNPREDVASVVANAVIDGAPITDLDATGYYVTIITAGHDTTSSTTAGGLLALLQHPEQFDKLRSGAVPVEKAVNEFLRWTTPIKHFFRTATEDCVVRGKTIRAGDNLMLCYPSANRDEEVFADPFAFRVDRDPNPQLSFGYGPHVCLGQHLAKLEIRIFYEELLARLGSISLAGDSALTETNFIQGLKRLPIQYSMRSRAA